MSISQYRLKDGAIRYRVRYIRADGSRSDKRGFTTKAASRQAANMQVASFRELIPVVGSNKNPPGRDQHVQVTTREFSI